MPLSQVGRFEILERLGEGKGFVYKALDPRRGAAVALKVVPAWMKTDRATMARFKREVQVEQVIEHPNLVHLHTVGQERVDDPELVGSAYDENGQAEVSFLVMEYVDGEDLRRKLARGALPLSESLHLATQIAKALDAIHSVGVVHRNLNPDNIRVTPLGQVKLLDFRLAKVIESESKRKDPDRFRTATGEVLGTVPYLAPENFQGESSDRRSDLFTLGVLLYQMISGELPFPQRDLLEYFHALENQQPPRLSDLVTAVPAKVDRIIDRLLAKDPAHRHQTAREILVDLAAVAA